MEQQAEEFHRLQPAAIQLQFYPAQLMILRVSGMTCSSITIILIIFAFPASECVQSLTTVAGQTQCQGDLIFEDNFNSLNTTKWRKEQRFSQDPVCDYFFDNI